MQIVRVLCAFILSIVPITAPGQQIAHQRRGLANALVQEFVLHKYTTNANK